MSFFGKNIRKIRNVKKLSQQAFAELFDLKRATLGAYEEERSEPKLETIIKIANYFSITIDDLLTKELTINKLLKFKEDLPYSNSFYEDLMSRIPCIFPQTEFEYIRNYHQEEFINSLPCVKLPLQSTQKRRAFVISTSEMASKSSGIQPNDMVVGEWLDLENSENISTAPLVMVITEKRLILRNLTISGSKIVLSTQQPGYEDILLKKEEILELWEIKQIFMNQLPQPENDLKGKLSNLEEEINKLKKYL
ncbi:helix-turn-helix domain-containing protein [Christiangramia flava]|uniref:Uncharacterized protein n=1 Tax=Christiangramia flava JLT2011 TaxID=1229726 RepID=A0A1L7I7A7_9FLAO|nr:helix-turn-helix transcriptional regulator [Christiangramia flava]APU69491.1 hypothetical protein GRFL_2767 [Christiangramia flava JLT2011]OSS37907.1 hypothetical protein C723_3186 [Christiangramia flava JLT2011]